MNFPTPEFDVLLVEDNPADAELTIEALGSSAWPIRFHHEADGVEAMAYLRNQQNTKGAKIPDLILLDLNMPRKSGKEVLAELKADEKLKTIPVLIFTTSQDDMDVLSAYRLNANGYISKPVDLESYMKVLRVIEDFWMKVVKLPPKV